MLHVSAWATQPTQLKQEFSDILTQWFLHFQKKIRESLIITDKTNTGSLLEYLRASWPVNMLIKEQKVQTLMGRQCLRVAMHDRSYIVVWKWSDRKSGGGPHRGGRVLAQVRATITVIHVTVISFLGI